MAKIQQLLTSHVWHPFTQSKTAPPPLKVRRGRGVVLELEDGRQIIDCISSWWVNIHGHGHPEVARAIYEQATELEHVIFAGFTHEPAEKLATDVLRHLPSKLQHVFFTDNGTTAVEAALKMALQYWQNKGVNTRTKIIAMDEGYHGETVGAMSLGRSMPFFKRFESLLFDIEQTPFPATWDGDPDRDEKENAALTSLTKRLEANPDGYAGIIVEPLIQGVAGMRMCSETFMKSLDEIVHKAGLVLIYDEVMTGFGRTGDWFASKKLKSNPDIMCVAKGLTGGFLPLALTVATDEIYQSFFSDDIQKAFFHSHSYMGNPIACAAANASLKLMEENEELFKGKEAINRKLIQKWLIENPKLEKLRVCGTIAAFDVASDEGAGYFVDLSLVLRKKFLEHGFLIRPLGKTIYLMPPYCITEQQLDSAYEVIDSVVRSL